MLLQDKGARPRNVTYACIDSQEAQRPMLSGARIDISFFGDVFYFFYSLLNKILFKLGN